jgi:deoxyadenosine/deoxycytidine kinase
MALIWVEGIIGAGKTTVVKALADKIGYRALYEPVETNHYLAPFYDDPKRWAFPMQMDLLYKRYAMQQLAAFEAMGAGGYPGAILDRVFAGLHHAAGNFSDLEWNTYRTAYSALLGAVVQPSVLIYLDVPPDVALFRIQKRNRGAEHAMTIEYLQALHRGYELLMQEIGDGKHLWSRGMRIIHMPWGESLEEMLPALLDLLAPVLAGEPY